MSPTIEWVIALLVLVAIVGAVLFFGRNLRGTGGGGHSGEPAAVEVVAPLAA